MVVGVAVIEIHVEDAQSLKAKRGVVRSIAGRLRSRFNVSVAEVGGQGTWQRATIGLSMSGNEEVGVRRALQRAIDFVEGMHLAQVLDCDVEVLRLPLAVEPGSAVAGEGLGAEDEDDWPWREDSDEGDGPEAEG